MLPCPHCADVSTRSHHRGDSNLTADAALDHETKGVQANRSGNRTSVRISYSRMIAVVKFATVMLEYLLQGVAEDCFSPDS